MLLALTSGIPYETWRDGDIRALLTALEIMNGTAAARPTVDRDGRQMSG